MATATASMLSRVQQACASNDPVKVCKLLLLLLSEAGSPDATSAEVPDVVQVGGPRRRLLLNQGSAMPCTMPCRQPGRCMGRHAWRAPAAHQLPPARTQGVFRSRWNPQVKRLAYDLVKVHHVSDEDAQCVLEGIKVGARPCCGAHALPLLRAELHPSSVAPASLHARATMVDGPQADLATPMDAPGGSEMAAHALHFLPHLKAQMLASMLENGEAPQRSSVALGATAI